MRLRQPMLGAVKRRCGHGGFLINGLVREAIEQALATDR